MFTADQARELSGPTEAERIANRELLEVFMHIKYAAERKKTSVVLDTKFWSFKESRVTCETSEGYAEAVMQLRKAGYIVTQELKPTLEKKLSFFRSFWRGRDKRYLENFYKVRNYSTKVSWERTARL